ncbi:uncharacterized protein MONBRDRAFT_38469 [Monosiga brevicollis MX1]|uniref:dolichyl-P-Man:Man5GlcNAc2-PP-dolichol alpha-1,3-mannosyltransferase n=1 Tax=Monosiga brevicollis TaxID=81824 RepID=A9V806_MONBE|nr:uncharacterized protein MONBRDRAFT_38469 [Monosiga brevicollis MX1]EDQ86468.1 predicted protein [Monosiga brevicollis MX1]|eukprot:XP_001748858.1 hypothetical protein [Monosiga brevicollis MX1]
MAATTPASWLGRVGQWLYTLLVDPASIWTLAILMLLAEVVLNMAIIAFVPYTEIDWQAYMDEVEGVVNGTYDYTQLKGDTGPLVYPAGFVYVFLGLYYATTYGTAIRTAQYIFAGLYLLNLLVITALYAKARMPPYLFLWLSGAAFRIHSIFVLRLFNDPIAMLCLYIALWFFLEKRWSLGSFFFSFGVGIKMNVLLYAPALLFVYLAELGVYRTFWQLAINGVLQILLAIPFLLANPMGYLARAFDLGRQFMYKWTVNWKLLSEETFLDRRFHVALLGLHICLLVVLARSWLRRVPTWDALWRGGVALTPRDTLTILFTANFVGMAVSRSLHYQFYSWYFHTIPFLLWQTHLPIWARVDGLCLHACNALGQVSLTLKDANQRAVPFVQEQAVLVPSLPLQRRLSQIDLT